MNKRALRVLEYGKIIDKLLANAQSELGRLKIKSIAPIKNKEKIEIALNETEEGVILITKYGNPPLYGIRDLRDEYLFAEKKGTLSPASLLDIADELRVSRSLKEYISDIAEDVSHISAYISALTSYRPLEDKITRIIISPEEIADDATSELKAIRNKLRRKKDEVKEKLNSIISSRDNQTMLQDSLVTLREGRYVVPVKSEHKSHFKGIVHDQSSSGQTVFIEPASIVAINNEIRSLELDEIQEINKILHDLSREVGERADYLRNNQDILMELDYIFSRSKLALELEATRPILNTNGYLNLKNARHPLLNSEKIVPISVWLGDEDFTTLIVTGPNTGGKTVTLKTVGLLTLMAMSGLFVPCEEGSELSIFNEVYADIGDEQSIEQSLSTFSSHMTNIVDILKIVRENDLVLFDELGAGTDPTEGAALAMTILDTLLKSNIRTIATTHYSQLKLYALTTEKVKNASVEFDVDTLSPTYRLLIGVPGKSNAFEISRRLGLSDEIIRQANSLISQENKEFEEVLAGLEKDRKLIENLKEEIEKEKKDSEKLKNRYEEVLSKTNNQKEKILSQAKEEAANILEEAKIQVELTLKELSNIENSENKEGRRKANYLRSELNEVIKENRRKEYDFLNVKADEEAKELKLGDEVEVLALGQKGTLLTLPDSKGNIQVEIGILKINSNIDAVKKVESNELKDSKISIKSIIKSKANQNISREIDLRGKNIEEARYELEKYLDDAYIVGLKEVTIIHGKGTGALRKGIDEYLRENRYVKKKRRGEFSEGGDGVTVVSL